MTSTKVTRKQVAAIVGATFPEYQGRKFQVQAGQQVTLSNLNWCEGTRSQYRTCTVGGQALGSADKHNRTAPWVNRAEGTSHPIPQGAIVVEHTIFCGRDSGLRIHVNPADMPKLLPAS